MASSNSTSMAVFNIVVMGDQYSGKTSLTERFTKGLYGPNYIQTIGSEFYKRSVSIKDVDIQLRVFDTAGQENMKTVIRSVYRMAQGILLVFDFTRKDTLQHIHDWIDLIETNCDIVPELILVGNKVDIEESKQKVTTAQAILVAEHHDIRFFDVSAKKNFNVDQAFIHLATTIFDKRKELYPDTLTSSIRLHEPVENKSTCCK